MPPHAGPLGRLNIPYDPEQYRDLLKWLYEQDESQTRGNYLIDAQQYGDVVQALSLTLCLVIVWLALYRSLIANLNYCGCRDNRDSMSIC